MAIDNGAADHEAAVDFHMREYETLRREIEADKKVQDRIELYALIGTGLVWSWIITAGLEGALFIPVLFSVLGWIKTKGSVKGVLHKAEYLRSLEDAVPKLASLPGWEHFIEEKEKRGKNINFVPGYHKWFWSILSVLTVLVPTAYIIYGLLTKHCA